MLHKSSGVVLFVVTLLNSIACSGSPSMLTNQQTETLIYFHGTEGVPVSALSRANPEAKEALRRTLKTKPKGANLGSVIQMLGYIGDESDVPMIDELMDDIVNNNTRDKLTEEQKDIFYSSAVALGFMSYRNISKATDIAQKYVEQTPWVAFGQRWYADEVIGRVPSAKYIAMDQFMQAYAVSQNPSLRQFQASLKSKAQGMTEKQLLFLDMKALEKKGKRRHVEGKKEIPEDFLAVLDGTIGDMPIK